MTTLKCNPESIKSEGRYRVTAFQLLFFSCLYRLAVQDASLWPMKPRFDSGYGLLFNFFFRCALIILAG